jgi:hypothetical protein
MARGGIYKSEVIRARTTLLSQGIYPSIDAVRQELGNTGSKATIHRYLKEIGEEEGGKTGGKVAISEALQDLVARLAERLIQEGEGRIAELVTKHAEERDKLQQALSDAQAHSTLGVPEMRSPDTSRATRVDRLQRQAATPAFAVAPVAALVPGEFPYVAGLSARAIPCPSHDKLTQGLPALFPVRR